MSFTTPNRSKAWDIIAPPAKPMASSKSNKIPRQKPAVPASIPDDQLASPFFTKLPPEIRAAILKMLIYDGSLTQHIAHFHGGGKKPSDCFVRSRCTPQQPDTSRHTAEAINLRKSPWRDGHWQCWHESARQSERRRRKHRESEEDNDAASAGTVVEAPAQSRSRQSVPLTSQTWSFSFPPIYASEGAADDDGGTDLDSVSTVSIADEVVAESQADTQVSQNTDSDLSSPLPLLLSCRRMHEEAADVLYTTMFFAGIKSLRYFFRKVTSRSYLDRIRHITLQWDAIVRQPDMTLAGHDLRYWDPACHQLAKLTELLTFDVKIFMCDKTPTWSRDLILRSISLVQGNARVNTSIVRDCKDAHTQKNYISSIRFGDFEVPMFICIGTILSPDG